MILVTGVSGALGGLMLAGLRAQPDLEVVAGTRSGDGHTARRIDFDDPGTLASGFDGVDTLVFVSAGYAEDDVVTARHGAVVAAAAAAGVRHVIYTSLSASTHHTTIAVPHLWTEKQLAAASFDVTVLRNGFYSELPVSLAAGAAESAAATGVFAAPFGTGRISGVSREDLAAVAVRVAAEIERDLRAGSGSAHAGRTYELEGVSSLSGAEIAEVLSESLGRPVEYRDVPLTELRDELLSGGLEPYRIGHTISLFSNLKAGFLHASHSDLPALLPTVARSMREEIAEAVSGPVAAG
ncbi:NmrA family NAD(P)-binding protein [Nocardia aurantiaca]|uniref:NAD(P)H-binding protein n=1 Tax=Nocardia aurantiaca TaxID=2675850 RepID=A0A6I3L072_9NOCA|nr:NmrA family NAD(P)-binding protein [Nocardia aurantiaca]MTE14658.1 NAD(P)H-binding protein [Nocardia aurantiaca]